MDQITQEFSLKNKIALVTGATGHLGQEMAIWISFSWRACIN